MRISSTAARSLAIAGLALTMCGGALAQESKPEIAEKDLPTAYSLFERCFTQMASEEAMEKITSASYTVATPEMMGPSSAKVSILPPNQCRIDAEFGGEAAYIVNNGDHIWGQGPGQSVQYGADPELTLMTLLFSPQYFLHTAPGKYQPMTSGVEQIGDAACYRVDLMDGENDTNLALFFNKETGACAGLEAPTDMGAPVKYMFEEWTEMEGIQVITKATANFGGGQVPPMTFGFVDYVFNGVDADVFEMSDEVKKLAEEAKADKTGAGDGGGH